MKFIGQLHEGDRINDIYLCKHRQAAVTKNGKSYENVILQEAPSMLRSGIRIPVVSMILMYWIILMLWEM